MASPLSKYAAFVFSRADYQDGVGYSSVANDFPVVLGPSTLFDTVTGIQRFAGRDPATGLPLIVTGYDRYITEVATDGVQASYDGISPPLGVAPDVCSSTIEVTDISVLAAINATAKHEVYGIWNCQDGAEPDDLPGPYLPHYVQSPIPAAKRTYIIAALIARGADATQVNQWFASRPEATPAQLRDAFAALVRMVS